MKAFLGFVFVIACVAGCAGNRFENTQPEGVPGASRMGFLGEYYRHLTPGPPGGARMRWFKPGTDFHKYTRIMMDSVVFYYSEKSEDFGIDAVEMKDLTDIFNKEIVHALQKGYPIAAEPAPDVIRLKIAITNLEKSKPALSAVTTVIPAGMGVSLIRRGATGVWSGAGEISIEVLALDSVSNQVIGAAQDCRSAAFTERFTSLGMVQKAAKYWGDKVRHLMDIAQGRGGSAPPSNAGRSDG